MENKIYDMIVIGGGPGGYTAALYAARAGLQVAVVERMSAGGQMTLTHNIDNYPGFAQGIEGFLLGLNMQEQAQRFGAETIYAEVTQLELEKKVQELDDLQHMVEALQQTMDAIPAEIIAIYNEPKLNRKEPVAIE